MLFRNLNVSGSDVSDAGITFLCGISNDRAAKGCKLLEFFFARTNGVTKYGITLAIQYMRKLRFLDNKHLLAACKEVGGNVLPPNTILKTFSIKSNEFLELGYQLVNWANSPDEFQKRMISYYGYLTNSSLTSVVGDVANELEFPTTAASTVDNVQKISFQQVVVPFLKQFGKSIQEIRLLYTQGVDIFAITGTCPLLQSITLIGCPNSTSSVPRPVPAPPNVEYLKVCGSTNLEIGDLLHLLLSPSLREIVLWNCSALCDAVLQISFRRHRFRNLERLTFRYCTNVSSDMFSSCFLSESNALTYIDIGNCGDLSTMASRHKWLSIAASQNWGLQIVGSR